MKTQLIKKPVVTEKATKLVAESVYMFEVDPMANKTQIKKTVEDLYLVTVGSVRSMMRKGKVKRSGRMMKPSRGADRKIVYVKVTKGKIDIFPSA